jgi:hypothetical protein
MKVLSRQTRREQSRADKRNKVREIKTFSVNSVTAHMHIHSIIVCRGSFIVNLCIVVCSDEATEKQQTSRSVGGQERKRRRGGAPSFDSRYPPRPIPTASAHLQTADISMWL